MRVAIVSRKASYIPRGIERWAIQMANELALAGHQAVLLTDRPSNASRVPGLVEGVNLRWSGHPGSGVRRSNLYCLRHLLAERYDLIVLSFAHEGGLATTVASTLRRRQRHVLVLHYPIDVAPLRYEEFKRAGLTDSATAIIGCSDYVAEGARRYFRREVLALHNGVDPTVFKADGVRRNSIRQQLGIDDSQFVILTAAALEGRKNVDTVIKAMVCLRRDDGQDYRLIIAGDGPHHKALAGLVTANNLQKVVTLLGAVKPLDMPGLYNAADAFALLSWGEGLPLVVPEAMASGLPVITSYHRPFPEFIEPPWGYMVHEGNSWQLKKVLRHLRNEPEQRHRLGQRARATAVDKFSWGRWVSALEDLSQ